MSKEIIGKQQSEQPKVSKRERLATAFTDVKNRTQTMVDSVRKAYDDKKAQYQQAYLRHTGDIKQGVDEAVAKAVEFVDDVKNQPSAALQNLKEKLENMRVLKQERDGNIELKQKEESVVQGWEQLTGTRVDALEVQKKLQDILGENYHLELAKFAEADQNLKNSEKDINGLLMRYMNATDPTQDEDNKKFNDTHDGIEGYFITENEKNKKIIDNLTQKILQNLQYQQDKDYLEKGWGIEMNKRTMDQNLFFNLPSEYKDPNTHDEQWDKQMDQNREEVREKIEKSKAYTQAFEHAENNNNEEDVKFLEIKDGKKIEAIKSLLSNLVWLEENSKLKQEKTTQTTDTVTPKISREKTNHADSEENFSASEINLQEQSAQTTENVEPTNETEGNKEPQEPKRKRDKVKEVVTGMIPTNVRQKLQELRDKFSGRGEPEEEEKPQTRKNEYDLGEAQKKEQRDQAKRQELVKEISEIIPGIVSHFEQEKYQELDEMFKKLSGLPAKKNELISPPLASGIGNMETLEKNKNTSISTLEGRILVQQQNILSFIENKLGIKKADIEKYIQDNQIKNLKDELKSPINFIFDQIKNVRSFLEKYANQDKKIDEQETQIISNPSEAFDLYNKIFKVMFYTGAIEQAEELYKKIKKLSRLIGVVGDTTHLVEDLEELARLKHQIERQKDKMETQELLISGDINSTNDQPADTEPEEKKNITEILSNHPRNPELEKLETDYIHLNNDLKQLWGMRGAVHGQILALPEDGHKESTTKEFKEHKIFIDTNIDVLEERKKTISQQYKDKTGLEIDAVIGNKQTQEKLQQSSDTRYSNPAAY